MRNGTTIEKRNSNWDFINEPFLDTQFSEDAQQKTIALLEKRGISKSELQSIRDKVRKPMLRYNSVVWEWVNLGLEDVLLVMKKKLSRSAFEKFYWEAIEIDIREK